MYWISNIYKTFVATASPREEFFTWFLIFEATPLPLEVPVEGLSVCNLLSVLGGAKGVSVGPFLRP